MGNVSELPVNGFEWVNDIRSINKKLTNFIKLIKSMMRIAINDIFLK